jgi:predicted DNA-binding protein (UPF0251 family)
MPRNRRSRKIVAPPRFNGYKPYGYKKHNEDPVELLYEEYEAIKLADYKLLNHQEASLFMGVSRATFARVYENARRKIALALVETKEIVMVSGNSYSDKKWFNCIECNTRFKIPSTSNKNECPLCHSVKIETIGT